MGAWLAGGTSLGAWITCLIFGILGYLMKVTGWARPPLVLGLILGGISENRFQLATLAEGSYAWLSRPIVLVIVCLIVLTILLAAIPTRSSSCKIVSLRMEDSLILVHVT